MKINENIKKYTKWCKIIQNYLKTIYKHVQKHRSYTKNIQKHTKIYKNVQIYTKIYKNI